MPKMDYSKLHSKILENGYTQKSFSAIIGVSESHFCQKLAGNYAFTQREIQRMCETLRIDAKDIGEYFFTAKVEKTQP